MSDIFSSVADRLLESATIKRDAGYLQALRSSMQQFLKLASVAENESDTSTASLYPLEQVESKSSTEHDSTVKPINSAATFNNTRRRSRNAFSPRLGYGVLPGISNWSNFEIPNDISPFITRGRDSFVARLFFTVTWHTYFDALKSNSARTHRIFRYSLRHDTLQSISERVFKLLVFLVQGNAPNVDTLQSVGCGSLAQLGDIQMSHEACHLPRKMNAEIVRDVKRNGENPADYLDCWEVETYLKTKWAIHPGPQDFKVLPSITHASNKNGPSGDVSNKLKPKMQNFSKPDRDTGSFRSNASAVQILDSLGSSGIDNWSTSSVLSHRKQSPIPTGGRLENHRFETPPSGDSDWAAKGPRVTPGYNQLLVPNRLETPQPDMPDIETLLECLLQGAVCFGDGVRFERQIVDEAASKIHQAMIIG